MARGIVQLEQKHFGSTLARSFFVFRLNSHREPYIYERHVDTSGTKRARFMVKLGLVRSESIILGHIAKRSKQELCFATIWCYDRTSKLLIREISDASASKRNKPQSNDKLINSQTNNRDARYRGWLYHIPPKFTRVINNTDRYVSVRIGWDW